MTDNCNECADNLVTMLSDQNYDQKILDAASKVSEMIAEYDKENPENVPSARVAKEDDYEGVEDSPEEDVAEKVDPKEMRDMSPSEHKAMLKKKSIIISID